MIHVQRSLGYDIKRNIRGDKFVSFTDDSAVGRSLVGTQVDTEVKEVFFAFAVFEEILLNLKVGPLERNLHDFSTEMNDGQVDGGIGKQRRMMLGNAFPPFMELGLKRKGRKREGGKGGKGREGR